MTDETKNLKAEFESKLPHLGLFLEIKLVIIGLLVLVIIFLVWHWVDEYGARIRGEEQVKAMKQSDAVQAKQLDAQNAQLDVTQKQANAQKQADAQTIQTLVEQVNRLMANQQVLQNDLVNEKSSEQTNLNKIQTMSIGDLMAKLRTDIGPSSGPPLQGVTVTEGDVRNIVSGFEKLDACNTQLKTTTDLNAGCQAAKAKQDAELTAANDQIAQTQKAADAKYQALQNDYTKLQNQYNESQLELKVAKPSFMHKVKVGAEILGAGALIGVAADEAVRHRQQIIQITAPAK